jgi:hypothetical protein
MAMRESMYAFLVEIYRNNKRGPGRFWIADDQDTQDGFWLCGLDIGKTKEQNLADFLKLAGRLSILEYE